MPIYVGVNGEAKLVTEVYIGNKNNQAVPLYLSNIIPKTHIPASFVYLTENMSSIGGYIDTGITPNPYTKIVLVFAPFYTTSGASAYNSSATSFVMLFGNSSSAGNGTNYFDLGIGYSCASKTAPKLVVKNGSAESINKSMIYLSNLNTIPQDYYTVIINKDTTKTSYLKHNDETAISLGSNNQSKYEKGALKLLKNMRMPLMYCAIYNNLLTDITPTKEYLPCIRKSDGYAGIYESVEGIFYTNTNLAAGPAIEQYNLPNFDN